MLVLGALSISPYPLELYPLATILRRRGCMLPATRSNSMLLLTTTVLAITMSLYLYRVTESTQYYILLTTPAY